MARKYKCQPSYCSSNPLWAEIYMMAHIAGSVNWVVIISLIWHRSTTNSEYGSKPYLTEMDN